MSTNATYNRLAQTDNLFAIKAQTQEANLSDTRVIRCEVCGYDKVATSAAVCPVCYAPDFAIIPGIGATRDKVEIATGLRGDQAVARFREIKIQKKREIDAKEKDEAAERQAHVRRIALEDEKMAKAERDFRISFFRYSAIATFIAWAVFENSGDPELVSFAGWCLVLSVPLSVGSFLLLIGLLDPADGG